MADAENVIRKHYDAVVLPVPSVKKSVVLPVPSVKKVVPPPRSVRTRKGTLRAQLLQMRKEEADYIKQKAQRETLQAQRDAAFVPAVNPEDKMCGHNFCHMYRDTCCECSDERQRPPGVLDIYEYVYVDTVGYTKLLLRFWRDYCPACQDSVSRKYTGAKEPRRPIEVHDLENT